MRSLLATILLVGCAASRTGEPTTTPVTADSSSTGTTPRLGTLPPLHVALSEAPRRVRHLWERTEQLLQERLPPLDDLSIDAYRAWALGPLGEWADDRAHVHALLVDAYESRDDAWRLVLAALAAELLLDALAQIDGGPVPELEAPEMAIFVAHREREATAARESARTALEDCVAGADLDGGVLTAWAEACRTRLATLSAAPGPRTRLRWPEACGDGRLPAARLPLGPAGSRVVVLHSNATSFLSPVERDQLFEAIAARVEPELAPARVLRTAELDVLRGALRAGRATATGPVCARPASLARIAVAEHGSVWLGAVTASCPLERGSDRCSLRVSFRSPHDDDPEPAPRPYEIELAADRASIADFVDSVARLVQVDPGMGVFGWGAPPAPPGQPFAFLPPFGPRDALDPGEATAAVLATVDAVGACRDVGEFEPSRLDALLDLAADGSVREVWLDEDVVLGDAGATCVRRALGTARFPTAVDDDRRLRVYGLFGRDVGVPAPARVRLALTTGISPWLTGWDGSMGRVVTGALSACHAAAGVSAGNALGARVSLLVAADGRVSDVASTPLSEASTPEYARCVEAALSALRMPCTDGMPEPIEMSVCTAAAPITGD